MTTNKEQGDKYINMMWGQIAISITVLLAIVGFFVTIMSDIRAVTTDLKDLKDKSSAVYKYEILPTIEQTDENTEAIILLNCRVSRIDSTIRMHHGQIYHLADVSRKIAGMPPQNGISYE